MRYFSNFVVRLATLSLMAFLAMPFFTFAQTGYGGGGGGLDWGPGGYTQFTSVQSAAPQGRVLGASMFNFTRTLSRGMEGDDVTELQKILIEEGFLTLDAPSGFFGPLTEEAMRAYQEAYGLEGVGIVGPLTRALLNARDVALAPQVPFSSFGNDTSSDNTSPPLLPQLQQKLAGLLNQLRSMLSIR